MHAKSFQLFPTLLTIWAVAHQAPLSVGLPRQEYWSGLPCSPPGDLSDLGIEPTSLKSPALAGGFFTTQHRGSPNVSTAAAAAKLLQSCLTLCDPIDGCCLLLLSHFSCVRLCVTPETAAHQTPPSLGFSRQEHWSGLPFLSPMHESEKSK